MHFGHLITAETGTCSGDITAPSTVDTPGVRRRNVQFVSAVVDHRRLDPPARRVRNRPTDNQ
jgi:hypothetical protein